MPSDAMRSAGFVTRAVAMAIDLAILVVMLVTWHATLGLVGEGLFLRPPRVIEFLRHGLPDGGAFIIALGYCTLWWTILGATPGKWLVGLRVVRARDGGPVRLPRAIVRFFAYTLSAPLLAGFLWVFLDRDRRTLHDHLAGTRVVYVVPQRTPTARLVTTNGVAPQT